MPKEINPIQGYFDIQYPSIEYLRKKAKSRIPGFAFDYLAGGANEEINMGKNHTDIQQIELRPEYIIDYKGANLQSTLFGKTYDAPFGVSPIGLQGLMWPNSPIILSKAAKQHNLPFILSTVSTASIEQVSKATDGNFWFQLYHPAEKDVRDDILERAAANGCEVLVVLADTPTFGIRYKDVKNSLAISPKLTVENIIRIMGHPNWALRTLYYGQPNFLTMKKYMPKGLNLKQLGKFMNDTFDGRLSEEKLKSLRDKWKGKLVVKGVTTEKDMDKVLNIGADGIIVSNHGGRQIDAGESTIRSLTNLVSKYKGKVPIMMDGGVRSGVDIGRCLASGADFIFMGRPFMYGAGALADRGGDHTMTMYKMQLKQVMEQLGCETLAEIPSRLMKS